MEDNLVIRIVSFLGMILLGVVLIPIIFFFILKWSIHLSKNKKVNFK